MDHFSKSWLDESFLKSCLSGGDSKTSNIRISSYELNPGVDVGNNFGSEIVRVQVTYKTEENDPEKILSLIMKAPIQNSVTDFMDEFFGMAEFNFYYKYLPKVRELCSVKLAPQSYFSPLNSVVVLEDLKAAGFAMADRLEQLDFDHCKHYFTVSGKLHAVGVALLKKYPDLPLMFPNMHGEFLKNDEKRKVLWDTIMVGLNCLVKSIEALKTRDFNKEIEIVKNLIENNGEKLMALSLYGVELQNDHFKSLIHGDCWTTNMMFKYDETKKPVDVRLLDFQIFNYDDVVSDVINFTWMSANNDVLENNLDELYRIYCFSLNSTLKGLGCEDRYSYERLKKEVLERSVQVLTFMGVFLPLTRAEKILDSSALFSETQTEDQFMDYYQGEQFFKKFPRVLKHASRQGVFDWLNDTCGKLEQLNYAKNNS